MNGQAKRRFVSLVLLMVVLLATLPAGPAGADAEIEYAACQCTGYAWSRRPDLPSSGLGDAYRWNDSAVLNQDGRRYSVGDLPSRNAVVVFEPGEQSAHATLGHVAYVEYAESESSYYLSEKNWYPGDPCRIHYRSASVNSGQVSFIYQRIGIGEAREGAIDRPSTRDRYGFWGNVGDVVTIRLSKRGEFDPYLHLRAPDGNVVAYNDDGGGDLNSLILNYRLTQTGGYTVEAGGYSTRTGGYRLALERGGQAQSRNGNLSLGSTVYASSMERAALMPFWAIDGRMTSRWSSRHGGSGEWIYVDLGQAMEVNRVRVRWETAYANRYWIAYWNPSASGWYGWQISSDGGMDDLWLSTRRYQHWLVQEISRPGWWGNISIWEYEIYSPGAQPTSAGRQLLPGLGNHRAESAAGAVELGESTPLPESVVRSFATQAAARYPELRAEMLKMLEK